MAEYPKAAFAAYADGAITKEQFMRRLAAWQGLRGMDYECRGVAGRGFVGVSYRGRNALIIGGALTWICGERRDWRGRRRYVRHVAGTVREFCRMVDAECARRTED